MSFEKNTLDYIIYAVTEAGMTPLAMTGELTRADALLWQGLVAIQPVDFPTPQGSLSLGIFDGPNQDFLLVRSQNQDNKVYAQVVLVPRSLMQMSGGNIVWLFDAVDDLITSYLQNPKPLYIQTTPTWTADRRVTLFQKLGSKYGGMHNLFMLLDAALDARRLVIRHFPPNVRERLELIQGLMLLLPSSVRSVLTFVTNLDQPDITPVTIVFSDTDAQTERLVVEYDQFSMNGIPQSRYVQCLERLWQEDEKDFVAELRAMELMSVHVMQNNSLQDGLSHLVERYELDAAVMSGEAVDVQYLKTIMREDLPHDATRLRYAQALMRHSLSERDTEAVQLLAHLMSIDDEMHLFIHETLTAMLQDEPDAVYFFVRTYLGQAEEVDESWLPVLHAAAVISLQIVIQDGDAETVMAWFRLIAREPASYELNGVLCDGIVSAKKQAYQDGELARRLLVFTAKRVPDLLEMLLDDEQFFDALDDPLGTALRTYAPQAVHATIEMGRELALIVFARALEDAPHDLSAAEVFSTAHIEYLWALYVAEPENGLPPTYQPATILHRLTCDGVDWLSNAAIEALLEWIITAEDSTLFLQMCQRLSEQDRLFAFLTAAFHTSTLSPSKIITLTGLLNTNEIITVQQVLDVYLWIAQARSWQRDSTLELVEQSARLLQQNIALAVSFDMLEQMIYLIAEARVEIAIRPVMRRMLAYIENLENEVQQVECLLNIQKAVNWSNNARNQFIGWWRDYLQTLPLSRLQQFDKALDGKKSLERLRSVVQTMIAVRKILGKRTLEEFADAISITYTMLQAFFDSFDNRLDFDQETVRSELANHQNELTPDERSVLAKNLKELATLIIQMADNRSKSSLMRREEDIERMLFTGEQEPQSAIDTMKWLSGYLNGLQGD
ncbi:MAG: hypothetical protein D6711_01270 [Chloroflexi bacterium]|nr:MAG: hypothetical protein D6711_01270 [Chloroflexota bacterium]